MKDKVGAVLVVGGGIAGIQAALDLADSGFMVYVVEDTSSIGGTMTQLDKTFPTNDCAMCILAPKLVAAGRHANIRLMTNAEIRKVEGEAGNFKVTVTRRARYVDAEKCTGCGDCAQECPVEAIDEYEENLNRRSAIFVKYLQAVPSTFIIDREKCIGCGTCQEVCRADAIKYEDKDADVELNVGAIILAPGFEEYNPSLKSEYGYCRYPNVVSSIEFERILSATGPYGGVVLRPSDGKVPKKIAFIQCVGSRDTKTGNAYCSSACCMYAIKEAVIAQEHTPGVRCTVFFMDIRAYGKEFDAYYNRAKEEYKVRFVRSRISGVEEVPGSRNLCVRYVEEKKPRDEEFNLVILSVGMKPPKHSEKLAEIFGIKLNKYNFCSTNTFSPLKTSRHGIYVCGAFAGPKDIPESVAQASGAAAEAASIIASERGKLATVKPLPPEKDVSAEEPRIGVFVCHCGINIGGTVDVPEVVEYAKTLPNVIYAEHNLYTCSQDTQERIREKIKEFNLNRVVVASCTPRTHEPLFRETVREAGLNLYLFEMANIRDQCSWVHMHEPEKATGKAKDLVRSVVAKARLLKSLKKPVVNVIPVGLVIGGGIAGMTAVLELARQGFEVHLVEKEKELGGHLRTIHYLLEGDDPKAKLSGIVKEVNENSKIQVYLGAEVVDVNGFVGNFRSKIKHNGEEKEIEHGILIVATGAVEYKPTEYLYGLDPRVMTQHELEEKIAKGEFKARRVVMVQCVGARTEERPNCSRICCGQALKNALKIKEINQDTDVYVLYKDVRSYGFKEDYYRKAAEKGVLFVNYDDERKPQVTKENGKLEIKFWEPVIGEEVQIEPDLVILSIAVIPNPDNKQLSEMLKVPLTKDGFFLEAHMKLRPVDFATDGIFLCGMAHLPKYIDESIGQACAAAARAATILSKEALEMEGIVANVDEDLCSGCRICESLCPYSAIEMKEHADRKLAAHVIEALCKGCGVCGAACPTKAITLGHFTTDEMMAQVKATLVEEIRA
ncbi:CoB--CoM heterodisulfide reductase iron-sulfur subunit A family protein [Candidatus Bathyarchaeota archaeon]|nr:CoB--CoM heterodisulfide reductase iron-sulfur subunit A family protein [Candidatus Bathyarchaeota archaeon]